MHFLKECDDIKTRVIGEERDHINTKNTEMRQHISLNIKKIFYKICGSWNVQLIVFLEKNK